MPHPTWLACSFAVVMVSVSLYSIACLVVETRRSLQHHVDMNIAHVAMGLANAAMLVPRLNLLPDGLWEAVSSLSRSGSHGTAFAWHAQGTPAKRHWIAWTVSLRNPHCSNTD